MGIEARLVRLLPPAEVFATEPEGALGPLGQQLDHFGSPNVITVKDVLVAKRVRRLAQTIDPLLPGQHTLIPAHEENGDQVPGVLVEVFPDGRDPQLVFTEQGEPPHLSDRRLVLNDPNVLRGFGHYHPTDSHQFIVETAITIRRI